MEYDLTFDPPVDKNLKKLDSQIQERILSKCKELRQNPHHYNEPLSGIVLWRLQVGDYRVQFDLYEGPKKSMS